MSVRTVFETPTVAGLAAALEAAGAGDWGAIEPADRSLPVPLSHQQERLWFLDRLDRSAGAAYHVAGAVRLAGSLEVSALAGALEAVVARHESLRTRFGVEKDGPVQVVAAPGGFVLAQEDAGALDAGTLEDRVASLVSVPFDLERGPLFRATLLRLSAEDHVLVVGGHHAVLDGWSVGLLLKEVSALYRERVGGSAAVLADLPVQYADYAAWQRSVLTGERLEAETAWWREQLSGVPEAIGLPFDRPRPAVMDYRGGSVAVSIPGDVLAGLKSLALSEGASLFMVLEAAFAALLHRVGGDADLAVGTAVAGRRRVELEALAGFFVNTVALRHRVEGSVSFREFLSAAKDVVLSASEHEAVPFEAVVEAVSPVRSLSHAPLVQVMCVLQNTPDASSALALEGVEASAFADEAGTAKFDLSLNLTETGEGLVGRLSYASQLFDRETAERLVSMYGRVLDAVVSSPETL
ncbi:condensation domain-containing protein, partial [Yoonia sp. R2-816]|uniref:condensation domain-containing protein n=1 Tax=Yoonia sp. R2-816 TaxID=3342638 RepID=UPI00372C6CDD